MKALTIEHLNKTYRNGLEALKDINLTVEEGDFFALLGPNGAGKSTTISILTSLVTKTSGSVTIFDADLDSQTELAKSYIGLVPQEFNFNGFEQVKHILVTQAGYYGVPAKEAEPRADVLLKQLGLWEKRHTPSRSLSGGMKRRLMIARALVHNPRLLILDEPTAGVDIELRRSMWVFLREINQRGTTIILTTHYLEEAENLCRNIAIIDKGRIVENTDMKSLLNRLDKETFVLDLLEPLTDSSLLQGIEYHQVDPTTIEVELQRQEGLNDLFTVLTERGIKVGSMKNKVNRLEELFLTLVERPESVE
ncbi:MULTISPECIES: ABC transporter ATP-binding protein [unclassified Methylophaga]|uniref:ABC transporter ATP-binding protein n=2 Tax=Methylophaga TaxID=40222 RepID=UPI000C554F3E|nr:MULTISPECIES: ABC transporter ATP-binding protein [unclassified Methylophaga]MAL49366.1 ABC transporter [Methylophaga sp.]MAP26909.1 ABC transporter [Methylophaga sp.]MBP23841.1 ABC transporter [Methylophaga sp.]MDX1750145.1 ABC transporter ATP-binding protein [Methylophaga sp.]HAD30502.1 ABC transporter [Methylophaga sp.]